MNVFLEYLVQNWALILILLAFAVMLRITVFLNKRTVVRMYSLIAGIFVLSIIVYIEFYLAEIKQYYDLRTWMTAIRYSSTPFILAFILFTLVKKARWYVLIPAFVVLIINIVSIYTGIVFRIDKESGEIIRGVLGYLPYIAVGIYSAVLVYILIKQSTKQVTEIIPIVFLAFAFTTGVIFPFFMKKDYSKVFCSTIAIALFVYYVFMILQLTKKDALTGLLNRQAYYSIIHEHKKDITAFVSIDMNGLKKINDSLGHVAGDQALVTLANCFTQSTKVRQPVFRIGGDEFVIICRKTTKEELNSIIVDIKKRVAETKYSCSIGYSYAPNGEKSIDDMIKESDAMMYADKVSYYSKLDENN